MEVENRTCLVCLENLLSSSQEVNYGSFCKKKKGSGQINMITCDLGLIREHQLFVISIS